MKFVTNNAIKLLSKAMDAYSLRQKITASNIANIDTPGYKKMSVSFEDELQRAEQLIGDYKSLENVQPQVLQGDQKPILENEMIEMADTQMRVQLVSRALRGKFEQIKTGITGRSQ